jgi:alkylation response protein AidB-like acyl-CoA dehydrogenase
MNLDFSPEQKALGNELRRVLDAHPGTKSTRDALEGRAAFDQKLWQTLGELGWLSVAVPEALGGQALGYEMQCLVAQELGRSLAAVPFVSSIAMAAEALLLAGSDEQKKDHLPALAAGRRIGALALVEGAGAINPRSIRTEYKNGSINGRKVAVTDGAHADVLIVVAMHEGEPQLVLVEGSDARVAREPQTGVDPSRPPAAITFNHAPAELLGESRGWSSVRELLDRAAVIVAFEQLGTADAALEMARNYALNRVAFGRLIGSYQAIKHKLVDVYVGNELARSNAYYGAWALESRARALPLAAATARVSATEALERASRELIQVHGGIGVTWEHDCHLYYRRAQHLGVVLGGINEWHHRLVDELRSTSGARSTH